LLIADSLPGFFIILAPLAAARSLWLYRSLRAQAVAAVAVVVVAVGA